MASELPVDFQERASRPKGPSGDDYPYAISATELMRNFVYASLDVHRSLYEETTGQGGHKQRRLKIPALPGSGTFVLGSVDGQLKWLGTEECD
jgi:hypothetical protein